MPKNQTAKRLLLMGLGLFIALLVLIGLFFPALRDFGTTYDSTNAAPLLPPFMQLPPPMDTDAGRVVI